MDKNQNLEVAKEILEIKAIPLNPNQMYKEALNLGLDNKLTFSGKTPWASFGSNFREHYFQAVSNSSWVNEGYLVALNIDESELMELIKKSATSFGIGVVSLNSEDISSSKIISPANFKENLDLNVINELTNNNLDFKKFVNTICDFDPNHQNRYKDEFDKVLDADALEIYIKSKGIR